MSPPSGLLSSGGYRGVCILTTQYPAQSGGKYRYIGLQSGASSFLQPIMHSRSASLRNDGIVDIHTCDDTSFSYIFRKNVSIPLKSHASGTSTPMQVVRCNIYLPHSTALGDKFPVLVTYGPYGKDVHYKECVYDTALKFIVSLTYPI